MIYIVRHGQTDWNLAGKYQGSKDIELNEKGIEQAEDLKNKLSQIKFTKVYSSPMKRAYKTATIISDENIIKDERLRERCNGKLEGKLKKEIEQEVDFANLNGNELGIETLEKFRERIYDFLDELCEKNLENENILIVTHAGVSIYAKCYFEGEPEDMNYAKYKLGNCEVAEYRKEVKMERKIEISYNYLTELIELIKEEKREVGYIKYPSVSKSNLQELKSITDQVENKILFHGLLTNDNSILNLCDPDFKERLDVDQTRKALELSRNNYISVHISERSSSEKLKHMSKEDLLNTIEENAEYLKMKFPEIEKFSLENREYGSLFEHTDFINEAVEKTGFYFLLDIAHAAGAAHCLNIDLMEYIQELPLGKVYEIHANGWKFEGDEFISHIKMNEECYEIMEYLILNTPVKYLTIEHGELYENGIATKINNFDENDKKITEEIIEQLDRTYSIVKRIRDR